MCESRLESNCREGRGTVRCCLCLSPFEACRWKVTWRVTYYSCQVLSSQSTRGEVGSGDARIQQRLTWFSAVTPRKRFWYGRNESLKPTYEGEGESGKKREREGEREKKPKRKKNARWERDQLTRESEGKESDIEMLGENQGLTYER